jgi:aspartate racemase
MKSFGILGGQGAVATMHLHRLIVEKAIQLGAKQDIDFPSLLISNIPSTSLSEYGVDNDSVENVREFILKHAPIFNGNVNHVVTACNTIHIETEYMKKVFGEKVFISLLDLVQKELTFDSKILLLCSETTKDKKLFEKNNDKRNIFVFPEPKYSLSLIENGMINKTTNSSNLTKAFSEIMITFKKEKCDSILLACTEMSIFKDVFENFGVTTYDSLEILANHIVIINQKRS